MFSTAAVFRLCRLEGEKNSKKNKPAESFTGFTLLAKF